MRMYFSSKIKWLLCSEADQSVTMRYLNHTWEMPIIGPRPPYYTHPRYQLNYAII